LFSQGTLQATGVSTDLALQGDGMFIVQSGSQVNYTRAGNFRFDSLGRLVDSSGALVQGWMAQTPASNPLGRMTIDSSDPAAIGNVSINAGMTMQPNQTSGVELAGNLDAGSNWSNLANSSGVAGTTTMTVQDLALTQYTYTVGQFNSNFTVYDSLGNAHQLTVTFTNISNTQMEGVTAGVNYDNNTWAWSVATDANDSTVGLLPDNVTYTDPVTGATIRSATSGVMHFTTGGALDWVAYRDANNVATGLAATWGITVDDNQNSIIGFEGATVATGDATEDVVLNSPGVAPLFDNPATLAGTGFDLSKLPIVLVYQAIPPLPATPQPPSGLTAGSLVNLTYGDMTTTAATTPNQAYVQSIDMDFGSVSTIQEADFDWLFSVAATELGVGRLGDAARDQVGGYGPVPQVTSASDGKRDGLTQDASGSWQIINGVNTYVPNFTAYMRAQDGYAQGVLQSISVDSNGIISGSFTNNQLQELARLAVASFENPAGLSKMGDTYFTPSANSGLAVVGTANSGGRGSIVSGALEQSNVDLSKELTDMIVAQRGFEVNARLVTTSDRILDTLVNMGR
jgi:flagellar hook protein FlgE